MEQGTNKIGGQTKVKQNDKPTPQNHHPNGDHAKKGLQSKLLKSREAKDQDTINILKKERELDNRLKNVIQRHAAGKSNLVVKFKPENKVKAAPVAKIQPQIDAVFEDDVEKVCC